MKTVTKIISKRIYDWLHANYKIPTLAVVHPSVYFQLEAELQEESSMSGKIYDGSKQILYIQGTKVISSYECDIDEVLIA